MASDASSPATTPLVLTPDSTGSLSPESTNSLNVAKKSRRQTAFYPNVNSTNKPEKPFSRSAAKRESVMALGSIEHLQHYFTKTGISAKAASHRGLVPAIGGKDHVRSNPSLGGISELPLPPSPAVPSPPPQPFLPFVKTYDTDPESLLPGVIDDLSTTADVWQIESVTPSVSVSDDLLHAPTLTFDVLAVLKSTTRTVRSVRNYLFSLPDESAGTIRAQFRSRTANPRPRTDAPTVSVPAPPDPLSLIRKSALEVLTVLRQLEENSRLPLSDEAYDAQSDGANSRGNSPQSRLASPSMRSEDLPIEELDMDHPGDMSISFSLINVHGKDRSVPVWQEEEDVFALEEEEAKEKKEHWDEKLVLGSGWLYKQDIKLKDLMKERSVVKAYVDLVDEVLFRGTKSDTSTSRGWERERKRILEKGERGSMRMKGRRVSAAESSGRGLGMFLNPPDNSRRRISTGMIDMMNSVSLTEEPEEMEEIQESLEDDDDHSVDEDDLPDWARRSNFVGDDLGRVHAILASFLAPRLLAALSAPSSSRLAFLESLSSGQLLCAAYNTCVRKSKHPWGFVSGDGIHDILALEQAEINSGESLKPEGKKGWTFRRTDNLRLWAGALKIRYLLPIHTPPQNLATAGAAPTPPAIPASSSLNSPGPAARFPNLAEVTLYFDARIVARKEEGWEDMLEAVLLRWAQRVVDEKRKER